MYEFKQKKIVEFAETDQAGIMHFSNFFRYMEMTEHAFYRSLGFSVHAKDNIETTGETTGESIGWPRVRAECHFNHPLRFEDMVEIHLLVSEKKSKSITYQFVFNKLNEPVVNRVAYGKLTAVCTRFEKNENSMKAISIPRDIADKISVAPNSLLE